MMHVYSSPLNLCAIIYARDSRVRRENEERMHILRIHNGWTIGGTGIYIRRRALIKYEGIQ